MITTRNTLSRRRALALSTIALTLSVCLTGMPHASADPYDGDDGTEVITSDSGYDAPADTSACDQDDWGGQDVTDTGDWDQGGPDQDDLDQNDYAAPDWETQDAGADADPGPAPEPAAVDEVPAPGADQAPEPSLDSAQEAEPSELTDVDTAQFSQDDLDLALGAPLIDAEPHTASSSDIQEFRASLDTQITTVTQWNSSWVGYDTYYRPIITNPYRTPLQLVYGYGDITQIVTVPPLQRTVLTVPAPGVYPFTAVTQNAAGKPVTVSTGSFSGGGYVPAAGQQPPAKPTTPKTYQNVLVQLQYSTGTSQPFRVKQLTDLGNDPAMRAERVLLDNETPAWGTWSTTHSGEPLFHVTKTQQLPGLTAPAEGALPGYDVQLAANQAAPASSTNQLVTVAIGCGVLGLASIAFFVLSGRRRSKNEMRW
jgi:hypothetical protein